MNEITCVDLKNPIVITDTIRDPVDLLLNRISAPWPE